MTCFLAEHKTINQSLFHTFVIHLTKDHSLESKCRGMPTFATFAPQAAASIEAPVEMFTVFAQSPPVPTMSTASFNPSTFTLCLSIAFANPTICLIIKNP